MKKPKILALGDVHIFNGKRWDEHKHVFENLYKVIRNERPDVIVVTGDVVDSKIRISPEQYDLTRDFLMELGGLSPVLMIPGNHDAQLNTPDRLDALTPILDSIVTEYPVMYVKRSGLHKMFGLTWAIWSCMDDQKNPFGVDPGRFDPHGSDYVIGLYHGVVSGAVNTDGYQLTGGIDINEFHQCDMVIMSDIHQVQDFRNGEISYTGSLIQVQVSENPHGTVLVYEDNGNGYDKRVVHIQNDYSIVTLDVSKLPASGLPTPGFLETQKLRVKYDTELYSRVAVNEVSKQLKGQGLNIILQPVVPKKDKSIVQMKLPVAGDDSVTVANISDFLEAYCKSGIDQGKLEINDFASDLAKLKEFDIEFAKGEQKEFEPGDFTILKVVANNMLSYGPTDNVVNMDIEGLIGIVGKNRVGKSSIIKIIQFVLFNEMPSNASAIRMINKHNRKQEAFGEVWFSKLGKIYEVKRFLEPNKKGTKVDVRLTFREIDAAGNKIEDLTKESRPFTDTEIRKYIGINETFEMLSLFSAQKRQTEFIDCKNAERLKLVNKFLSLQSFELKEDNVKKILTEKNAVYNNMIKTFDKTTDINMLKSELSRYETLFRLAQNSHAELRSDMIEHEEMYKDVLTVYNSSLRLATKKVPNQEEILREEESYKKKIELFEESIESNKVKIAQIDTACGEKVDSFTNAYGIHPADFQEDRKEGNSLRERNAVILHETKRLQTQLAIDICNSCGKEFTFNDKAKVNSQLRDLYDEMAQNNKKLEDMSAALQTKKKAIAELEKMMDEQDEWEKINTRNVGLIKDLNMAIRELALKTMEYTQVEEAKVTVNLLKDKKEEYDAGKREITEEMHEKERWSIEYKLRITATNKRIDDYRKKVVEIQELEDQIRLLKVYRKIVAKDGLPLYILKSKIEEINEKVNTIVNQVFDFNVEFSIDDDKGELRIQFSYPGDVDKNDVGLASGSETFIINLCIKVALSQISTLPKIDTVFIDEGYDSLDKDTVDRIPALFDVLTNYYKNVVTISHLDEIKEMCSHHIELRRKGKYTEII